MISESLRVCGIRRFETKQTFKLESATFCSHHLAKPEEYTAFRLLDLIRFIIYRLGTGLDSAKLLSNCFSRRIYVEKAPSFHRQESAGTAV
jgi:hypothetical protein